MLKGDYKGKEHDRAGAEEEGFSALYAGCESSTRNGTRPLRSPCCTATGKVGVVLATTFPLCC